MTWTGTPTIRFYLALALVAGAALLTWAGTLSYFGTFIRGADGQMYYMQLRSLVVDGDLDYENEVKLTPIPSVYLDRQGRVEVPRTQEGRVRNNYTCGWAMVTFVPYAATHGLCLLLGGEATGYSRPYEMVFSLWHVGLTVLSLGVLGLAAARIAGRDAAAVAMIGTLLATNLIFYAAVMPIMAQAASFVVVGLMLACAIRLYEKPGDNRLWLAAAAMVWFMVMLRPTDVVLGVVLLPALWKRWNEQGRGLGPLWAPGACAVAVAAAVAVQLVFWRAAYGYWVTNPYGKSGMGFNWFSPDFPGILISTGKTRGAWYLHPFYALGVLALLATLFDRKSPWRLFWIGAVVAYALHTYVHSAWFNWAHSFGQRIFINSAPILLVAFAWAFSRLRPWARWTVTAVVALMCVWNLLLMGNFNSGRIPMSGVLTPGQIVQAQADLVHSLAGQAPEEPGR